MGNPLRALVVEDSEDDAFLLTRHLQRGGFDVDWLRVETEAGLKQALNEKDWDIVFSDFSLPHLNGLEALRILRESGIETPAILVSGAIGEEIAVEAMKSGAQD
jgi:sigma-B regulation protein RsbU (phosphoserine phosphatase)